MPDDPDFAAASTFVMTNPLTPRYPEGSRIVTGKNRPCLPPMLLLAMQDERYTAYFDLTTSQ
ncbi:hypothetical protein HaLaN_22259 [Haematococcus lacustris]|uniref:Uncharacterized protein n=1 Tax=Haematococcus lacustris TaxID=44745 RepID=A0A699ZNR2_HAELA|nr:hypothetical protein HaLaN_22259 [Haematococcus lacustris]